MPTAPLVTVVTPSYMQGRFIGETLESVAGQSYPRIEHLVLDACSSDETAEVLRAHARAGLTVRVEKDAGQVDALNKGFSLATGDVLCWLNADDYWLSDTVVEEAVAALDHVQVVTGGGLVVTPDRRPLKPLPAEAAAVEELRYHDKLLQPATFWRREVHRALRLDLSFAFDWAFFLELAGAGASFEVVDRSWAAYRWHDSGKTALDSARRKREIATILREQNGALSAQHLWARLVAAGYATAEALRSERTKYYVACANDLMRRWTNHRVYSG